MMRYVATNKGAQGAHPLLRLAVLLLGLLCVMALRPRQAWAATAAGTAITETVSATYTDGQSNNYNATSNTVTTYAQNAPAMTMSTPAGNNISIGVQVVDTFTFTNTGNGTGTFALTGDATFGGTAPSPTLNGYVLNGASSGTCSTASPCTYATLNSQSGMASIAATSGTATVGVAYTASSTSQAAQTIQISLTANVAYAAATGITAATSANVTSTPTDTVYEPRIDVQETASTPSSSGSAITWTVTANNGGNSSAYTTIAVAAVTLGGGYTSHRDIAIIMKMPAFGGSPLGLTGTPTCSITISGGCSLYYSTSSSAPGIYSGNGSCSTLWCTTYTSAATWMMAEINLPGGLSGGPMSILPSAPSQSSGAGSVSTPQITVTFITNQPSGSGSGNSGSVTNMANALVDDANSVIIGPGISVGTADSSASALTYVDASANNATPSSGTTPPGGSSNQGSSQAYASYTLLLGPNAAATATGAWSLSTVPGYTSGTASNTADFTFIDFLSSGVINSATNSAGAPSGNSIATGATPVTTLNTLQNTGNTNDTYVLSNSSNTGWTVAYYASNCSTALGSNTTPTVSSGSTYTFCAKFTPPTNATGYTAYDFAITATSSGNGSVTNVTHDVLYAGGPVAIFKTYAVSGCPGGVTPANSGVISGCTITVTVTAVNEAPAVTAGSGSGNVSPTATTVVVTENGGSGDNWASLTAGLTAAPNLTGCASCTTTGTTHATNFTVTIPTLAPQASATYTYAVVVN